MFRGSLPVPLRLSVDAQKISQRFLLSSLVVGLAGCGSQQLALTHVSLTGQVFAGRTPVAGSSVQVYAAGSEGNGAASVALSEPILSSEDGSFSLPSITCPSSGADIYVVANAGNPGLLPARSNLSFTAVAALGACGKLVNAGPVVLDDLSTAAAANALTDYIRSSASIGSNRQEAFLLSRRFDLAAAVTGTDSSVARGSGVFSGDDAMDQKLRALANLSSACSRSAGGSAGDGSACGDLFSLATPADAPAPTTTFQALVNIARNPSANVAAIFQLASSAAVFQPALPSAPADWRLSFADSVLALPIAGSSRLVNPSASLSAGDPVASVNYTQRQTSSSSGVTALPGASLVRAIAAVASVHALPVAAAHPSLAPGVLISPASVSLYASQSQTFTAQVSGSAKAKVKWTVTPAIGKITPGGVYTAPSSVSATQTLTVTATSVANASLHAGTMLTLHPAGVQGGLSVTASGSLDFTATQGSTEPLVLPLNLHNAGGQGSSLKWTATSKNSWLTFGATSGSLKAGVSQAINVIANPAGLGVGIYSAMAQVQDITGTAPAQLVQVTLTVRSVLSGYPVLPVERTFPADANMVNVKTDYGAKGDGVSDDTAAIQRAITQNIRRQKGKSILYFPAGIYLVSRPLLEKDVSGAWQAVLTFQGENAETTILKLSDKNSLYQDPSNPQDLLDMASFQPITPKDGGGNDGFDNFIFDMTLDVGSGNPGATALDFMGNNFCGLRNVRLQSSDPKHVGAVGLSMLRYATGPCLMKNVVIDGFNYGISAGNTEYSATFESLTLLNQNLYGIMNAGNVLSIRGLVSTNKVPAVFNQSSLGLITLLDASLLGGTAASPAIQNNGTLYARNISSSGYSSALKNNATPVSGSHVTEYDSGPVQTLYSRSATSLNLAVQDTPQFEETNLSHWANAVSFGADPSGKRDSTAAIQAAIESGATTVYLPTGTYLVSQTIYVHGNVRMLHGFDSTLLPTGDVFQNASAPKPMFQVDAGSGDVTFNHILLGEYPASYPGTVFIEQNSSRPIILLDGIFQPTGAAAYRNTLAGTGTVFVEDLAAGPWQILHPQKFFARQINPEVYGTKILNSGGTLWILGLKTERDGTNIETNSSGATELLGGLLYPVLKVAPDQAAFIDDHSQMSLVYAVSNYSVPSMAAYGNFQVQVMEAQDGATKTLPTRQLPTRGYGVMMPLFIY